MLITCKCLNLSINAENAGITKIDSASLGLTSAEQSEAFFKESFGTVELLSISKEQTSLIENRLVNGWTLHRCLNCNTHTHAIKRDQATRMVLVNTSLLVNPEEISALRASDKFSSVFKIVLDHPDIDPNTLPTLNKYTVPQMSDPLRTSLSSLQAQMTQSLQHEVATMELRIRVYTEQQYAVLEEFRERAHREHRILASLITQSIMPLSSLPLSSSPDYTARSPMAPLGVPFSQTPLSTNTTPTRPVMAAIDTNIASNGETKKKQSKSSKLGRSLHQSAKRQSLDGEGVFDLEGMDGMEGTSVHASDEESELEREDDENTGSSEDEGLQISRSRFKQRVNSSAFARSLPVSVPAAFLSARHDNDVDSDGDMLPMEDGLDIAASIKALAKSVHGDAVFGDLPRPRFSTQI